MTFGVNTVRAQCQSALLRLWQQHRLTLEFHPRYLQMEKLVIDAE